MTVWRHRLPESQIPGIRCRTSPNTKQVTVELSQRMTIYRGAAAVSACTLFGAVVVALDLDGMGRVWYNVGAGKKSRTARKKSRNTPVLPTGKRPRSKERPGAFLFSQASRADGYPRREIPEPLPEAERWGTDAGHGRGRDNCKISRRRTLHRSSRVYPPMAHTLKCGENIAIKDFPEI